MANDSDGRRGNASAPQNKHDRGPLDVTSPARRYDPEDNPAELALTPPELIPLGELYAGTDFPWSMLRRDAAHFARVLLLVGGGHLPPGSPLHIALAAVAEGGGRDEFQHAAEACYVAAAPGMRTNRMQEASVRLDYYAAASGCPDAAARVARHAVVMADNARQTDGEALDLAVAALGWLTLSSEPPQARGDRCSMSAAIDAGERVFDRMARAWRARVAEQETPHQDDEDDETWNLGRLLRDTALGLPPKVTTGVGMVVVPSIGGQETAEGRRVLAAYGELVGAELPLAPVPDIPATRRALAAAYPHAAAVIDAVCTELAGRDHVRLQPIIVVGAPGCGKTAFAEDLMAALGLRHVLYPCGGASDPALAGNPRRWVTGELSTPLALMASHRTASPGIVLDELEKAGSGKENGCLQDALLAMLEPRTASRWLDPYLQAPIDLSHVVWVATANSLDGVSPALRDRFRVIRFPDPGVAHLPVLANRLLQSALRDRGMDVRWALPLDGMELAALAAAWSGGSLRRLARLVAGVLAERDRAPGLNWCLPYRRIPDRHSGRPGVGTPPTMTKNIPQRT